MNAPQSPSNKSVDQTRQIRGPEIGPALKRERLLRRVQAAGKRLTSVSSNPLTRLR
jgi:hypothetical protein